MRIRSNLLLLSAAAIWGFAFVAQRVGMDHVGPFTFNGVRFALGGLSLLPVMFFFRGGSPGGQSSWQVGTLAGTVLFIAASLQQAGMIYTTAGKAAFITCLYIVLVPLFGVFLRHRVALSTGIGSLVTIVGLYLLCIKEGFTVSHGDLLELAGSFFWTAHILLIDRYARSVDTLKLAFFQFITCSLLSLCAAFWFEDVSLIGIQQALIPILYGGFCSAGIAYTLQIVGQKNASPAHAAIILSMETVFAALGGYLLLQEVLGSQEIMGCVLMLAGMLISQLYIIKPRHIETFSNLK